MRSIHSQDTGVGRGYEEEDMVYWAWRSAGTRKLACPPSGLGATSPEHALGDGKRWSMERGILCLLYLVQHVAHRSM